MPLRKSIDRQAILIMFILCAIWGFQQIALKLSAADLAPTLQIGLRSIGSALLVALVMRWKHEPFITQTTWKAGLLSGVFFGLEFLLLGEGLRYTTASHTVVFLYTAPIFVALTLHGLLPAERLQPLQWLGIVLAFLGIALSFLGKTDTTSSPHLPHQLWGDVLALGAGLAWAATTVTVRFSILAQAPATQTLQYQLFGSAIMSLIVAPLSGQTDINFTPIVWSSLAFQIIIVSFLSYLIWFALLKRYYAAQLGVVSFMTPLFGVLFGVIILHEPLEMNFIWGAMLVMSGIILVSSHKWLMSAWHR